MEGLGGMSPENFEKCGRVLRNSRQYNTRQDNTDNFYIAPVSSAWPSSKAFQIKKHRTENICPEESHIRHQEIGKSTN